MIGWYVHHHGHGHLSRARAVLSHLQPTAAPEVTLFGTIDAPDVRWLPSDVAADDAGPVPAANLHHAPLGVPGLTRRMAAIAAWIDREDPALFVIDVSVEVATFVRLMGVPTVVVRQHGRRDDAAHLMAYEHACALLAPYDEALEDPWVPGWIRRRTTYTGGFSRFDGRTVDRIASRRRLGVPATDRVVVVQAGAEAVRGTGWDVGAAAAATSPAGWRWTVLGPQPRAGSARTGAHLDPADGVGVVGWQADPWDWLCAADVVVTHAGHNSVVEAATAGAGLIAIPRPRPFDEQGHKARALHRTGAAVVREAWPAPADWPALLDAAAASAPGHRLADGSGARRAAEALRALAGAGAVALA